MKDQEIRYDDGKWYAVTLGHFIGLLVDTGLDPAVRFRVVGDTESDENGLFLRTIEVVLVPNGYVARESLFCERIHKTLKSLLEKGVVT